jgi:hypothetical protein
MFKVVRIKGIMMLGGITVKGAARAAEGRDPSPLGFAAAGKRAENRRRVMRRGERGGRDIRDSRKW